MRQAHHLNGRISLGQKNGLFNSMIKYSSQNTVINKSVSKDPLDMLSNNIDLITL